MAGRVAAAIVLVLLGALLRLPVAAILGGVLLLVEVVHATWQRRGLLHVRYARRLRVPRLAWGEETVLDIEVWNRKRLPLAWLRADDAIEDGLVVRDRPSIETEAFGPTLVNTWTLAPFERVIRHLHLSSSRRGVFAIGPANLSVGDLFARPAAMAEIEGQLIVTAWPKVVPAPSVIRPERWGDLDRARRGLVEDPSRFAGIRPYSPGDPIRRIHGRASARLGTPMTKKFEPSRERDVLIALDLQTEPGPTWELAIEDEVIEGLFVIAASVSRSLEAERAAFGLTAAGYSGLPNRFADVPVAHAAGQGDRVLDLLARLSTTPSARFESLLGRIERRGGSGTTIVVLTARPPRPFVGQLRRLAHAGFGVAVLAAGPDAVANAAEARAAGFAARAALLDGPWRSATRLRFA
jgi:uncharacterized protein (DUF58 family)